MGKSTKEVLAAHLRRRLDLAQTSPNRLVAHYQRGPKKGKRISSRAIGYMLETDNDSSPGPNLDAIEGVAKALNVAAWQLLADEDELAKAHSFMDDLSSLDEEERTSLITLTSKLAGERRKRKGE